jgi:AcrR family transcriptional regulator
MQKNTTKPSDAPEEGSSTRMRVEDRKEQLIEIAMRLFATKGFDGTSLRDIAEEAQITKAALYYHFPNKDALYESILVDGMRTLVNYVSAAMGKVATPEGKVREFMLSSADYMERNRDSWIAGSNMFWFGDNAKPRPENLALRDEYEKLLRDAVKQAIDSQVFQKVDPTIASRMLLAVLNQLPRWHSPTGRLSTRQVVQQYIDMIFQGLLANNPTR